MSLYLWLLSGVPPGLVILCQQQLLVEHVHPLLPLDVQRGSHPQWCLTGWLGALTTRDVNNTLINNRLTWGDKERKEKKQKLFSGVGNSFQDVHLLLMNRINILDVLCFTSMSYLLNITVTTLDCCYHASVTGQNVESHIVWY